ncbi:MAG: hypothetical protein KA007_02000 [Candidatus Pacebacteria bacterium]|nr:hypothetical protein [Candidatus Paceibacterota bacterium]
MTQILVEEKHNGLRNSQIKRKQKVIFLPTNFKKTLSVNPVHYDVDEIKEKISWDDTVIRLEEYLNLQESHSKNAFKVGIIDEPNFLNMRKGNKFPECIEEHEFSANFKPLTFFEFIQFSILIKPSLYDCAYIPLGTRILIETQISHEQSVYDNFFPVCSIKSRISFRASNHSRIEGSIFPSFTFRDHNKFFLVKVV